LNDMAAYYADSLVYNQIDSVAALGINLTFVWNAA